MMDVLIRGVNIFAGDCLTCPFAERMDFRDGYYQFCYLLRRRDDAIKPDECPIEVYKGDGE